MDLFQKAINNDFDNLTYEEISEIFPLIFYSVPDLTEYLSKQNLTSHQSFQIFKLDRIMKTYLNDVPINELFTEVSDKMKNGSLPRKYYTCNDFDGFENVEDKFRIIIHEVSELINNSNYLKFNYSESEILNNLLFHSTIKIIICIIVHEHPLHWRIADVVKGLLYCKGGLDLIKSLALNFPHEWHSICYSIIDCVDKMQSQIKETNNNASASFIHSTKSILDLNPSHIYSIFEYCLKKLVLPELVLTVALDLNEDNQLSILDFLKLVLLDENHKTCKWFTRFLKSKKESSLLKKMKSKLIILAKSLIMENENEEMLIGNVVDAQLLLRILAALKTFADFKFEPELSYYLIKIITHKLPITPASVELIQVSVAFVLLFKSNFTYDAKFPINFDSMVTNWLRHLLTIKSEFNSKLKKSYSEFLLLLVLIYNTQRIIEVEKIFETLFGFQIKDHSLKMNAKMITQDVFVDKEVALLAASVPVNHRLNSKMTGHLPINCVLQLIKSRSFSRNKVQINKWIFQQICESISPIHPKLITLINNFVDTLLPTDNCGPNEPIPECDILSLFSSQSTLTLCSLNNNQSQFTSNSITTISSHNDLTPHVLLMYYLLYLREVQTIRLENEFVIKSFGHVEYSQNLWFAIPIRYLLVYTESRKQDFHDLYPSFLRLITKFYPHLVCGDCMIQDDILYKETLLSPTTYNKQSFTPCCSVEDLDSEFENFKYNSPNPNNKTGYTARKLLEDLEDLSYYSAEYLVPYAHLIVRHITDILDSWNPDSTLCMLLLNRYTKIWIKLHLIMPRRLQLMTVNSFQYVEANDTDFMSILRAMDKPKLTEENILENPVEILLVNVKKQIFRCVPVLDIYLRIIESVLLHSNNHWYHYQLNNSSAKLSMNINSSKLSSSTTHNAQLEALRGRKNELDTLRKSLLQNEAATIIQMLLEKCLLNDNETSESDKINILAVHKVICNFIHSMFINDQDLCHIVHWQSYPRELLSVAIQNIPSMHISLDTIEKNFLNSGDYNKLIFMLDLVSHIGRFYNVKKAQDEATKLLEYFQTIVQTTCGIEERAVLIWLSVDPIIRIGTTFPNLLTTVSTYLTTTAAICASFCNMMDNHIVIYDAPEMEEVISDEEFSELDLDEQYHLCYCRLISQYDVMISKYLPQSNIYT